jgi:hypothetical protein
MTSRRVASVVPACALAAAIACGGSPSKPDEQGPSGGGESGPQASPCASYAGTWNASHVDQCGVSTTATVTVTDSSCQLTFTMPDIGQFTFSAGDPGRPGRIQKTEACSSLNLAGAATEFTPTRIAIVYGEGPDGCCRHGGFLLTR